MAGKYKSKLVSEQIQRQVLYKCFTNKQPYKRESIMIIRYRTWSFKQEKLTDMLKVLFNFFNFIEE